MATYDLVEGIADAVIAYIEANQAAKLTAVEARYTTPVGLTDFTVRMGDVDQEREPEDAFPLLYVSPTRTRLVPSLGGLERACQAEHGFTFAAIVWRPTEQATEMPAETMKRATMRYAVALVEMLIESRATTGYEWATLASDMSGGGTDVQYRTYKTPTGYLGMVAIQSTTVVAEVA